jgi:hypothetical protein
VLLALLRRSFKPAPYAIALAWGAFFLGLDALLPMSSAVGSQVSFAPGRLLSHVLVNLKTYLYGLGQGLLYPFAWNRANDVYHLIAAAVAALGFAAWLRARAVPFVACFALAYGAMLLVIPTRAERYLWVLYPLIAFCLLAGLRALLAPRLGPERGAAASVTVGCLLAALAVSLHLRAPRDPGLEENPQVQQVFGNLAEIASHRPVRAVFFKPRNLTWATRIPAMGPFVAAPRDVLEELERQGITHVVLGDFGVHPERQASLRRALQAEPGSFRPGYANASFQNSEFARAAPARGASGTW